MKKKIRHGNRRRAGRWSFFLIAVTAIIVIIFWNNREPKNITPVTAMHPIVATKQAELKAEAADRGISIVITDGLRTVQEQDALYRQGRTADGQIVTNVKGGDSFHQYGLAFDFALRAKDGEVLWDLKYDGNHNGLSDWMEVVSIAKRKGFSWGGDWENFRDYPHLQMDFGYSIRELKRGERPPLLEQ